MLVILGFILGIILGVFFNINIPIEFQPYLPIAVIAALDALLGALRAYLSHVYNERIFVVSFIFNVLVAAFIVFLGDKLGIGSQLTIAVIVVMGIRIFANTSQIRRIIFKA